MKIVLIIVAAVALGITGFLSQKSFGKLPSGERKERVERSPFWKDGVFENETPAFMNTGDEGFLKLAWKFLSEKKTSRLEPEEGEITVVRSDLKSLPADKDCFVWFGHSSFLLHLSGKNILVDPVFYECGPAPFGSKAFKGTDVYRPADMPDTIDYLVISHDHWDHLDYKTAREMKDRIGKVLCPLGIGEDFEYWGFPAGKLLELDCNEDASHADFIFRCLPTRHFSGRGLKRMRTQRASWLIEAPSRKVFYTGDGGFSERFARFGQTFPDIDLAIMENGQYDGKWSQIHTMPEELGRELKDLRPARFVTVHHSKYALANHDWDEPLRNEQVAAEESGIPLIVKQIGEIVWL